MKAILTSSFFWRFAGGFALGGFGVMALHPAGAQTAPTSRRWAAGSATVQASSRRNGTRPTVNRIGLPAAL